MAGGLLQLITNGKDNIYLVNEPEITLFKIIYRRHTNFSIAEEVLHFNKIAQFGDIITCKIRRLGDLLHKLYLMIDLPVLSKEYIDATIYVIKNLLLEYDIIYNSNYDDMTIMTIDIFNEEILPLINGEMVSLFASISHYNVILNIINNHQIPPLPTSTGRGFVDSVVGDLIVSNPFEPQYRYIESTLNDSLLTNTIIPLFKENVLIALIVDMLFNICISRSYYHEELETLTNNVPLGILQNSLVMLNPAESAINDYYKNWYIRIGTDLRKIIAYDGITKIATIDGIWSFIPNTNSIYTLYYTPEIYLKDFVTVVTPSTITFGTQFNDIDDYYRGWYIMSNKQIVRIISYDGTTKIATIDSNWIAVPSIGDAYHVFKKLFEHNECGHVINSSEITQTIELDEFASDVEKFYNDWYIYISLENLRGNLYKINTYDYITKTITIYEPINIPVGTTYYLIDKSMEANIEIMNIVYSSVLYTINLQYLYGQLLAEFFNYGVDTYYDIIKQYADAIGAPYEIAYKITDAYTILTKFFKLEIYANTIFTENFDLIPAIDLSNTYTKWNLIRNIKQQASIVNTLKNNITGNIQHFRFGIYNLFTYQQNIYVPNIFTNVSGSTDIMLNDNFTNTLSVTTTSDEPSGIQHYYEDYVSSAVNNFHVNNTALLTNTNYVSYLNDITLLTNLLLTTHDTTIPPAELNNYKNLLLFNLVPLALLNDISLAIYNFSLVYFQNTYSSYNYNTFLNNLNNDVTNDCSVIRTNILLDILPSDNDKNYLSYLNSIKNSDSNYLFISLFRPEVSYTIGASTELTAIDYILTLLLQDTLTNIGNFIDNHIADITPALTPSQITLYKNVVTTIINSFRTPSSDIPSYATYSQNYYSIIGIKLGLIIPAHPKYCDAISSLWYNIIPRFITGYNNFYKNVINYANTSGINAISNINNITNFYGVDLFNETSYYYLDTTNFSNIVNNLNTKANWMNIMINKYIYLQNLLLIQVIPYNQKLYTYESFTNIFNNEIVNYIAQHKDIYYPILYQDETTIIYDDANVNTIMGIIGTTLTLNVFGIIDMSDYIYLTFFNSVFSLINPFPFGSNLYQWYDSFVLGKSPQELNDMITYMNFVYNDITSVKMFGDSGAIYYGYTNLQTNIYLLQYIEEIIARLANYSEFYTYILPSWQEEYNYSLNIYTNLKNESETKLTKIGPTIIDEENPFGSELALLIYNIITKANPKFSWINYLGFYIIDYVSIIINDQEIDKHTGEWLYFNYLLNPNNIGHKRGLEKMIGFDKSLITYDNNIKNSTKLYVPFIFWFCNNYALSLIMVALNNSEIKIRVKFKNLDYVVKSDTGTKFTNKMKLNCELLAQYIYVEHEERLKLAKERQEQLVEILYHKTQNFVKNNIEEENKIRLNIDFPNSCKEIVWALQWNTNDMNDFTNEGKNIIKRCKIRFNSRDRENYKNVDYYNYITPLYRKISLPTGIMYYSFAINPLSYQPSGSANFSKLESIDIIMELEQDVINKLNNNNMILKSTLYCESYNIFRYLSGLGALLYYS